MSSFTTTTVTAGVKRAYEEDGSLAGSLIKKPRTELAPLELLLSDVFIHIFKDFGFKDLLNVETVSTSFWNKAEGSWKLMAQKDGRFDLESYPMEGCPERWQCLVREALLLHIKNKKNTAIEAETIKKSHAGIFQLFPRLGALIWRNLNGDQKIFPRPDFVKDSAQGGDFLLEGLYQLISHDPPPPQAFTCLSKAIEGKASCVINFALRMKPNTPVLWAYTLAKQAYELGDPKGLEYFFRKGLHRNMAVWKKDLHLPFIAAQLLFNSGLSWEEKERGLDSVEEVYNQNLPSWLKARCAYIKFKLRKQEASDRLYKEALDDFKLSIPEQEWGSATKALRALYLEIDDGHMKEAHKFYEMAIASYRSEEAVPALMWAGMAHLHVLEEDSEGVEPFIDKAILASNGHLPEYVWESATGIKWAIHGEEGLIEITEKALADLAGGDIAKAPDWLKEAMRVGI